MKIYKVLELAKPYLWDGKRHGMPRYARHKYICCCIRHLATHHKISTGDACNARDFVNRQLGGASTLELWLHNHSVLDLRYLEDTIKMQATRLAWLNHMIEFCKKENI